MAVFLVETPGDFRLMLCYYPFLSILHLFLVCCYALFPAKSMVPPPGPLPLCVGCVTFLFYLCDPFLFFLSFLTCLSFCFF